MNIIGRINLPEARVPLRGYLHATGVEAYTSSSPKLFIGYSGIREQLEIAEAHLQTIFSKGLVAPNKLNYIIAIFWGHERSKEKIVECFGFSGIQGFPHWPGNPDVKTWKLIDGVYYNNTNVQRKITCGDGIIILGQEEAYRRRCKTLDEYLQNPPEILDPKRVQL